MELLLSFIEDRAVGIVFIAVLVFIIFIISLIQKHKARQVSDQELSFFRRRIEELQIRMGESDSVKILGENRDSLKSPSLRRILRIPAIASFAAAILLLSIPAYLLVNNGFKISAVFYIPGAFAVFILIVVVASIKKNDTIDTITINRSCVRLLLLDKNRRTDPDAHPLTYDIGQTAFKYRVRQSSGHNGSIKSKRYYVLINNGSRFKEYAILVSSEDAANLFAFIAFANLLSEGKDIYELTVGEIRELLTYCKK